MATHEGHFMNNDVHLFSKGWPPAEAAAREAQRLEDLRGPGIVAFQGRGRDGELLLARAASSLADVLHERGPLPAAEVRAVGAAAAAALGRVHEAGLVHGDVKPSNLLLSEDGELWLADFDGTVPADGRTLERYSPGRLPPNAPARPKADIVALALTLVELSTGALLDPRVAWRATDLRRLGCSPGLCTEIALMLGDDGAPGTAGRTLNAQSTAEMFSRNGRGTLPTPASQTRQTRHTDPTPTVEFMPARPQPESPPERSPRLPSPQPPRWWRRLADSWRGAVEPAPAAGRSQPWSQVSDRSQARRSS